MAPPALCHTGCNYLGDTELLESGTIAYVSDVSSVCPRAGHRSYMWQMSIRLICGKCQLD